MDMSNFLLLRFCVSILWIWTLQNKFKFANILAEPIQYLYNLLPFSMNYYIRYFLISITLLFYLCDMIIICKELKKNKLVGFIEILHHIGCIGMLILTLILFKISRYLELDFILFLTMNTFRVCLHKLGRSYQHKIKPETKKAIFTFSVNVVMILLKYSWFGCLWFIPDKIKNFNAKDYFKLIISLCCLFTLPVNIYGEYIFCFKPFFCGKKRICCRSSFCKDRKRRNMEHDP